MYTEDTVKQNSSGRVAVIGAGIVGVLCAWRLVQDGHRVTLIDRLGPGEGCSFGNACMISPDAVVPYNSPSSLWLVPKWLVDPLGPLSVRWQDIPSSYPWLAAWVKASTTEGCLKTGRAMAALHLGAIDAYRAILGELGASDLLLSRGQMQVSRQENGFVPGAIARQLREEFGVVTEQLDASAIHERVPALSPSFRSGLFFPNNGQTLSSYRLTRTIAEAFQRAGGEIRHDEVRNFRVTDGAVGELVLSGERLAVDQVVLAAGIGSRDLLRQLGQNVPLQAERGYHLTMPHPAIELPFPVSNRDRSFAVTPTEHGLRFAGTVEIARERSTPNWKRAEILSTLGEDMFPGLKTGGATRWMGSRPSFPDGLPVLGRHPDLSNMLLAFGNGHYGVTAAPKMAEAVAALASKRPVALDLRDYSLSRFG